MDKVFSKKFLAKIQRLKMALKRHKSGLLICHRIAHNRGMEELLKVLELLSIDCASIEAIRAMPDKDKAREYAVLLIALHDDRCEYVD